MGGVNVVVQQVRVFFFEHLKRCGVNVVLQQVGVFFFEHLYGP
jgi:hypothetical protein